MFKVCSRCGQEYQAWATECTDCRVPLVADETSAGPEPARTVPVPEDLVLLGTNEPSWLQTLAQALQERGVPSRIDTHPPGDAIAGGARGAQVVRLGIYVGRADYAAARAIADEIAIRDLPDAEAGEAFTDPNACPACGEPVPENAPACSACGLEFSEVASDSGT